MNDSRAYHMGNYPPTKARKAAQACNQCRKRRRRCEGGLPCFSCLENSTVCVFDDNDRPAESFRRALRHAQQHANKADELSQKLDRLTAQLHAFVKRNDRTRPAPAYDEPILESNPQDVESTTSAQCPIERWPEVHAMLRKAQVPEGAACIRHAETNANSCMDLHRATSSTLSVTAATIHPRKRKRFYHACVHLDSDRRKQPYVFDDADSISRSQATALIQSYVRNVHVHHPIVDLAQLTPVLNHVVNQSHPSLSRIQLKETFRRPKDLYQSTTIDSMPHALLYIILALGEMCEWKRSTKVSMKHTGTHVEQREYQPSSPVSKITDVNSHIPRTYSSEHAELDPGSRFYERATHILGLHLDGNELIHAQVCMLAGLYKSLLSRLRESMSWVSTAGRVIQNLLQRWNIFRGSPGSKVNHFHQDHVQNQERSERKTKTCNHILLTAWACIQLESDMLSRTKLPQSGLLLYEDVLPLPSYIPTFETDNCLLPQYFRHESWPGKDFVLLYNTAHLKLRKEVSRVRQHYYGAESLQLSPEAICRLLRAFRKALDNWRLNLPEILRWTDDEPVPKNDLSSRLQLKYYEALLDVYRPYLDYVLHIRPHVITTRDIYMLAVDSNGHPRGKAEIYMFHVIRKMPDPEVWQAVQCYLEAALRIIGAVKSVSCEPYIPELHSILSAQYRAVLTLCTAYLTPCIRPMFRLDDLMVAFRSSIIFFKEQTHVDEWCSNICTIWQKLLPLVLDPG